MVFIRNLIGSTTFVIILITLLCNGGGVDGARILGFFAVPSKSHLLIHSALADALAEAGHEVTVIGSMPNVYKNAKYKYIQLDDEGSAPIPGSAVTSMINKQKNFYLTLITQSFGHMKKIINGSLVNPTVQQFMREHTAGSFDLIILGYFMNDAHLGLAAHFKCPIILSMMIQPVFALNNLMGNPAEIAYVPALFANLHQPMGFKDRIKNYLAYIVEEHILTNLLNYIMQEIYNYNFPAARYATLNEVRKNISLAFVNHHFSQGPIRPNVPAVVEIGGIQIKEQQQPLPADLAELLEKESTQDVILFSLGSIVKSSHLNTEVVQMIFNVLAKLPYKVICKWSADSEIPIKSANIIYKNWLPQDDLLAHASVKLFITHAGQGSVVESQYHGVPMVAIPLFGDQQTNAVNMVRSGFGLSVDYHNFSAEEFRNAILEVANNPKYSNTVKQFSRLYRDRPMTARQTAVYWVDYVLRHGGAPHLQSPAVHMNRWQLMSLDVIGFLLAMVAVLIAIFITLCKLICCRGRKKKLMESSKQKKNK